MFLKLFILSLLIVSLSLVIMGFKVLFTKDQKFPVTEIAKSPEMHKLGIKCAKAEDALARNGKSSDFAGCISCSFNATESDS